MSTNNFYTLSNGLEFQVTERSDGFGILVIGLDSMTDTMYTEFQSFSEWVINLQSVLDDYGLSFSSINGKSVRILEK